MESQIWKVQTEKIGSLEAFSYERDMESFLMNNPAIVGCWDPDTKIALPTLIRSQICVKSERGEIGRMDLVGLGVIDNAYEFRIFELKVSDINEAAVEQLRWYLENWKKDKNVKEEAKRWILDLKLQEIDENLANELVDKPVGVLVAPKFQPEAISKASELGIQGIRLARFKSEKKSEYFVIVEDQIGEVIGSSKRQYWSWQKLSDAKVIRSSDKFSISHKETKLFAEPDLKYLDYYWKFLIYDEKSVESLLKKEIEIRKNAEEHKWKWIDKDFKALKNGEGLVITHASALFYFAFGGPYPTCYWTPTGLWKHVKSGKTLDQLVIELFEE